MESQGRKSLAEPCAQREGLLPSSPVCEERAAEQGQVSGGGVKTTGVTVLREENDYHRQHLEELPVASQGWGNRGRGREQMPVYS